MTLALSMNRFLVLLLAVGIFFTAITPALAVSTWTNQGNLSSAQYAHKAVLLDDGKVFIAGGYFSTSKSNRTKLYTDGTGSTGSWQNRADMIKDRDEHTLHYVAISGGSKRVLAIGGASSVCSCVLNAAELWDQSTNSWTATPNMNTARRMHASSLLDDGKVLVTGGLNDNIGTIRLVSTEVYDPVNNTWTQKASMSASRAGHAQVTFTDSNGYSKVMVIGGVLSTGVTATTEIYDPSTNTWSAGPNMNNARNKPEALVLNDGRILVVGGGLDSDVYDPVTNSWSAYSTPYDDYVRAVRLSSANGYKVLAAGGNPSSNAMVFDPSTNTWSATTSMNTSRREFTLTLLNNGEVLAAGGANGGGALTSSERFAY